MNQTIQIQPLTLENVGDGAAETAFQSALAEIAGAFTPPETSGGEILWQLSDGQCTAKVTIEVTFVHDFESGATAVAVVGKLKLPDRRKVVRPVIVKQGGVFCEPSQQLDLLSKVGKEGA
jgi:hypothetical protein